MDALLIDGYALLIDGDALEPWTIGESLELLIQGDALLGEAELKCRATVRRRTCAKESRGKC